jgi:hypothetical protein
VPTGWRRSAVVLPLQPCQDWFNVDNMNDPFVTDVTDKQPSVTEGKKGG